MKQNIRGAALISIALLALTALSFGQTTLPPEDPPFISKYELTVHASTEGVYVPEPINTAHTVFNYAFDIESICSGSSTSTSNGQGSGVATVVQRNPDRVFICQYMTEHDMSRSMQQFAYAYDQYLTSDVAHVTALFSVSQGSPVTAFHHQAIFTAP